MYLNDEECSKMRAIRRRLQRKYRNHPTPENKRKLTYKHTALTRKIMKSKKKSSLVYVLQHFKSQLNYY